MVAGRVRPRAGRMSRCRVGGDRHAWPWSASSSHVMRRLGPSVRPFQPSVGATGSGSRPPGPDARTSARSMTPKARARWLVATRRRRVNTCETWPTSRPRSASSAWTAQEGRVHPRPVTQGRRTYCVSAGSTGPRRRRRRTDGVRRSDVGSVRCCISRWLQRPALPRSVGTGKAERASGRRQRFLGVTVAQDVGVLPSRRACGEQRRWRR